MASYPFMLRVSIPYDISDKDIIEIDGRKCRITKIKSIKFYDMRTVEIIGLCKGVD